MEECSKAFPIQALLRHLSSAAEAFCFWRDLRLLQACRAFFFLVQPEFVDDTGYDDSM